MKLEGKRIVVIGGSSGIGLAAARLALNEGAAGVTIAGRSAERLDRAREGLADARVTTAVADVADPDAVTALFAGVAGPVDHVFNSSGDLVAGSLVDGDLDTFQRGVDVRIWGNLNVVRAAVPHTARGGSITLMSGQLSSRFTAGVVFTTALANAVEAMARGLALDLAPFGIRANAIAPGYTDTPLMDAILGPGKDAALQQVAASLPVGRVATPEEVAEAVLLLMTNGFLNGEVLHIDGGGRHV
jgi:NAD(P)-dependent dehydrogenase (short-subunit alcohol dehydrogenase family)